MNSKILVHHFKQLDLFTKPVQLLIKKEVGHKTVIGASISMLLIITMSIFFINSVIVYLDRSKPITLTTEVYHAEPDLYKLRPQNFTLQFAFQDSSFATYIDESIYNVEALLVKKEVKFENGTSKSNYISQKLPLIRCSQDIIKQESLSEYFQHFDLNTNYCIDWNTIDEINLQGTFDAQNYQYILLKFKMCNNKNINTDDLVICKSQEDIIKQLNHNYLSLQLSSYYVDLQNPNNPYIPKGEDLFTTISSQIFKEITIYLQPVTTHTDTGAFFSDIHFDTTVKYMQQTEMIDFNDGYLLANVAIRLHTIEQVNYRQYSRIQTVLAELGGLWNVLFTIAMILQAPISSISYKLQIVNSLFNFEGQEETYEDQEHHLIFDNQDIPIVNSKQTSKVYTEQQIKNISTDFQLTNRQLMSPSRNNNNPIKKSKFQRQDSFRSSIRSQQSKIQQKLQEINKQCIKIQNVQAIDDEQKEQQLNKLNQQIKGFFQTVSKRLKISFLKYLKIILQVSQEDQQVRQLNFSISRMEKSFDILYIIKKLHEIDKLKMILLNKDQLRLFDYLPKPTITSFPDKDIQVQQYFSILKPIKSNFQMALEAQQAFREISNKLNDPINQQLINCMDESMLEFLQFQIYKNEQDYIEDDMIGTGIERRQKRIDSEPIQDISDNQCENK